MCGQSSCTTKNIGFCPFLFRRTHWASQAEPFSTPTEEPHVRGTKFSLAEQVFPPAEDPSSSCIGFLQAESVVKFLLSTFPVSLSKTPFQCRAELCRHRISCEENCGETAEQSDSEGFRWWMNVEQLHQRIPMNGGERTLGLKWLWCAHIAWKPNCPN